MSRVRSDLIETFKIIHEIDKVDKNLFLEFDSGGSRCGQVGSGGVPVGSGGVRCGPVGSGGVFSHTPHRRPEVPMCRCADALSSGTL